MFVLAVILVVTLAVVVAVTVAVIAEGGVVAEVELVCAVAVCVAMLVVVEVVAEVGQVDTPACSTTSRGRCRWRSGGYGSCIDRRYVDVHVGRLVGGR